MEGATGDDVVYVAVGKVVEESKLTLLWASRKFNLNSICILHVHQPAKRHKSSSVRRYSISGTEEHGVKEIEMKIMQRIMDEYVLICNRAGVSAEKLHKHYIEMDDVSKGIVELIHQKNIKKLVMGAAADMHYFEGMVDLKSEKALYVYRNVPLSCQVWFICRGHLVRVMTRAETGQSNVRSSPGSSYLACSSEVTSNSDMPMLERTAESECGVDSRLVLHSGEDLEDLPTANDEGSKKQLYDQLEQALSEAEKAKREAFEESMRRVKAEKSSVRAMRQVTELERLQAESLRSMREIETVLAEQNEELEKVTQERDKEHLISLDQKKLMETQLTHSEYMINELETALSSAVEQLNICEKERDMLREELGNAEKRIDEILRRQEEESYSEHGLQFFSEFSISEVNNATEDFDPSLKIGAGAYGCIYKGSLHHTTVAIKVHHSSSLQGASEFQQEVDLLSRLRHPNLVTLIGICPEICALIYEYLPNGSLEDRLNCRDDTSPLPWQTRIHIATELCLVLIFLRSCKPHSIVHGNLKPANILLDANFVCKLSDFVCSMNDQSNMSPYTDPELYTTGVLSPSSDIYSFGIILLQLLTGRAPLRVAEEVQHALNVGELNGLLDPSAGCWPYLQAAQLSHLALRCCAASRSRRPDLASEVLTVLEPMRASCGASSSFYSASEDVREAPSYFICPISQDIMKDPHIAADGFTYEAEELRFWLQNGHDTSPMTNVRLAHLDLIPNYALRSAILEWMQQR